MLSDKIRLMRDETNGPFFVGEIGQNHNGDIEKAKRIIIGIDHLVDVIKTVYRDPEDVIPDKPYGGMHSFADQYRAHRDNLDLDFEEIMELKHFVEDERKLVFGCSFYGVASLEKLVKNKVNFIKFPSRVTADEKIFNECIEYLTEHIFFEDVELADVNNFCGSYRPIVGISLGMCNDHRVNDAIVKALTNLGSRIAVAFFHTTSAYPTKLDELNLSVIVDSIGPYNGLSCHYPDSFIPDIVATGRGCYWFERHISLEDGMRGRDHHSSISVKRTSEWCKSVRDAFIAMGERNGIRKIVPSELENMKRIGLA